MSLNYIPTEYGGKLWGWTGKAMICGVCEMLFFGTHLKVPGYYICTGCMDIVESGWLDLVLLMKEAEDESVTLSGT